MDEFMGDRPLSNVLTNGVDVGFEEEEATCSTPASQNLIDASDCSINDEYNDGAESTEQLDTSDNRSGEATNKRKRHRSSGYAKAMGTWMTEQQGFLQRMQESQNRWVEEQQQRRLERDQRLLTQFVEESSRANERLVTQLLYGLRTIIRPHPARPPPPVAPYSSQHSFPNYSGSTNYSPHTLHYSDNSEYILHDLD